MRRAKIVWNNQVGKAAPPPPPTLPRHFGNFPSISDFFKKLPKGFTEESYVNTLTPGAMFNSAPGTYVVSDVWKGSDAEVGQVSYASLRPWNPSGQGRSVLHESSKVCIYLEQRRLTEWDGKGWARVLRPVFIIDGTIAASLGANVFTPIQ